MYSACLFCNGDLGRNESIEQFPVGRRLAFDAAKGRLWVVCRRCERWNLTPLEERWEAIESCERAFRETRLRVSTDEIGLAKLREGLELVRIGAPQRPEMAAWRYGDQFGRRTRRNVLMSAGTLGVMGAVLWGGPALGLYTGGVVSFLNLAFQAGFHWDQRRRPVTRVSIGEGDERAVLRLAKVHALRTKIRPDGPDGWSLDVHFMGGAERLDYTMKGMRHLTESVNLKGEEARRALAQVLPHINTSVARRKTVGDAVHVLEDAGSPERMFEVASRAQPETRWSGQVPEQGQLHAIAKPVRLALEMAVHEESERRALEGELHVLEAAWREAEEIAGIADDLLLPEEVGDALARLKGNEPR
jgi:hypothetical protein